MEVIEKRFNSKKDYSFKGIFMLHYLHLMPLPMHIHTPQRA